MKFCAALGTYPKDTPGGAEVQAYYLCQELASRGHDVHYVAHSSGTAKTTDDAGIHVHREDIQGVSKAWALLKYLEDMDADVYYFRNKADIPVAALCSQYLDGTTVYNIAHDYQCQSVLDGTGLEPVTLSPTSILSRLRTMYWRMLLRYPERILAQTRQQQRSLEENRGIQSQYVGNGHPVPGGSIEKETPPVVLWLASLKAWKQPETFLSLARECRDLDCQFWLVGRPADADVHQRVTEATSELENTTYKGGCSFEESNDFFERASLFVNTSIAGAEGFPNTFVQAWLRKTPVVSLHKDVDGALAAHDVGALAANEQQFIETVRNLMTDSEKRVEMGERAREFATERYSIGVVVDRLEKAIQ